MISIIIPAYNCAETVKDTLNSLEKQTIKDFEIILINDGSKDNTLEVLELYASAHTDVRIQILSQENKGPGSARNLGLQHAKGDLIAFVDADDQVPENYLEMLSDGMTEDVDFVFGRYERVVDNDEAHSIIPENQYYGVTAAEDVFASFICFQTNISLWNSLFRASIIRENRIRFLEDCFCGEDINFIGIYLIACQKVNSLQDVVYKFFFDTKRADVRQKNNVSKSLEESTYAQFLPLMENRGWNKGIMAVKTGRFPVYSVTGLMCIAQSSGSYEHFYEQIKTDYKALLNEAKKLKSQYLPKKLYLKAKALQLLLRCSYHLFYRVSTKGLQS